MIKAHPKVTNFYSNMGAIPPSESTATAVPCDQDPSSSKVVEAQNQTTSEPMIIEDVSCPSNGSHIMAGVEDIGFPTDHYVEDVSFPSTGNGFCKQEPIEDEICKGEKANAVIEDVSCPSAEKVAHNLATSVDSFPTGVALFSPEASTIASQDSAVATQPKSPLVCLLNKARSFLSETKERLFAPKSPPTDGNAFAKTCSP